MAHSEPDAGIDVLSRLRTLPPTAPSVLAETSAIQTAIDLEGTNAGAWSDLFSSNGMSAHKRFYLALGIQFMQQLTGINIVTYYAPTLYQTSLGMSAEQALYLGCWTQVWYVAASFLTWYTIDRVGRRALFISCALGMCAMLVGEAVCVALGTHAASIGAVVFIFLFEACFTWGWMATVWIYPAEILPLRLRAKGAALAAAADFLGNFLVVEVTPPGLKSLGWKFYIVWAVLNVANAVIVWLFYPETGGLPLEAVDGLFLENLESAGGQDGEARDKKWYLKMQWDVVPRSIALVKEQKAVDRASKGGQDVEKSGKEGVVGVTATYVERTKGSGSGSGGRG